MIPYLLMLERVALNQAGFKIPGVAPDARGVLLGKQGAVLLATVDRLVAFFRLLSEESSLDDILPSLKIHQVRTRLESREFLLLLHASSSYLMDRCARVAALCGGLLCTGSGKHYVKYRDRASSLGYDTDVLYDEPADFILYTEAFTQGYTRAKEISFAQLLLHLSLRSVPGGRERDLEDLPDREILWLAVRRGLGQKVLQYLWRNRVKVSACVVSGQGDEARGNPRENPGENPLRAAAPDYYLLRVSDLPERMLRLFGAVPGIEVFLPTGDNYVVELGYRHPVRLESCASIFDKDRFYLFCGQRDTCEVLPTPPPLLPGESLLQARFDLRSFSGSTPGPLLRGARPPAEEHLQLRLCQTERQPVRVTATLVPWARARWFKQLVYLLPPPLLQNCRVAPIEEGLFIVCEQGIDGLPIGQLFHEVAPSIFVPAGMDFLPRVGGEVLTEHVGGVLGKYVVFLPGAGIATGDSQPISIPLSAFEPLGRRALAPLKVSPRQRLPELRRARPPSDPTLVNDPVGPFPLWGFREEENS